MKTRLQGLDLLRCIAILVVLFLHSLEATHISPSSLYYQLSEYGWIGVDIFFVLSGFLIGHQVFKTNFNLPLRVLMQNFWVKRWFRTLPLYFVVLITYIFIKPLVGFQFSSEHTWSYFFFLQNYLGPKDFIQSWSLCVEEQFYIVFPLLIFILKAHRFKAWVWLVPIGLSIYLRYWSFDYYEINTLTKLSHYIRFMTHNHLDGICFGVFLAKTYGHWIEFSKKNYQLLSIVGVVFTLATLWWIGPNPFGLKGVLAYFLLSVGASISLMGFYHLSLPNWLNFPVYWISITSYGLYLWNNLMASVVMKIGKNLPSFLSITIFFILSFILAFITYKLIEEPWLNKRKAFLLPENES